MPEIKLKHERIFDGFSDLPVESIEPGKPMSQFNQPEFEDGILVIVGGYGSGKSEVAVNLAVHLAHTKHSNLAIADIDIVNPYFRSREAIKILDKLGIRSIVPPGAQAYADLPIILPEVKGAIESNDGTLILDVGGDDVGSRVLSSLTESFPAGYEMLLVLNSNRPFTSTLGECLKLIEEIESASRLKFTGIISNSHMLDDTTSETVLTGLKLSQEVSDKAGLPLKFISATSEVAEQLPKDRIDVPVLKLDRMLLKPWEIKG